MCVLPHALLVRKIVNIVILVDIIYQKYKSYTNINTLTEIAGSGLMFTNNVEYTYEFNGMTIINPPTGNNENNSELKIKGTVKVAGIQNCGAIVDLLNVEITQGSEVFYFSIIIFLHTI